MEVTQTRLQKAIVASALRELKLNEEIRRLRETLQVEHQGLVETCDLLDESERTRIQQDRRIHLAKLALRSLPKEAQARVRKALESV